MPSIQTFRRLALMGLFVLALIRLPAMSVLPPSFDELVVEATRIVRGTVTSVAPFEADLGDGRKVVKTRVTWKLDRTLKGPPRPDLVLDFLGGELPHLGTEVPGMPSFQVGQTDYLFLGRNEQALCPLIAGDYGRFHVRFEAGTGQTTVESAVPASSLISEAVPSETRSAQAAGPRATATSSFEAAIQSRLKGAARP